MSLIDHAFCLSRPVLQRMDGEDAHLLTIRLLKAWPSSVPGFGPAPKQDARLAQKVFGLDFPNPLGLAPGFDKNAEVPDAMLRLGFGFVEVGTLTPLPQAGNPRPRLFRLAEDRAVINRMGFNNGGQRAALRRLGQRKQAGIVGINIGANKDSADRAADYVAGIAVFSDVADYITVNISSPNTPGLRGLQSAAELEQLLARLNAARATQARKPPMLLKIAPDLRDDELADIASCCSGGAVDGVIISNTTLSRPGLSSRHAGEAGGLSGRPLRALATRQLAKFHLMTKGLIPLIGAGGVEDADSALEKIRAGASLVQVYSALVYKGPGLVAEVLAGISQQMDAQGLASLADLRGRDSEQLAHQSADGR